MKDIYLSPKDLEAVTPKPISKDQQRRLIIEQYTPNKIVKDLSIIEKYTPKKRVKNPEILKLMKNG